MDGKFANTSNFYKAIVYISSNQLLVQTFLLKDSMKSPGSVTTTSRRQPMTTGGREKKRQKVTHTLLINKRMHERQLDQLSLSPKRGDHNGATS